MRFHQLCLFSLTLVSAFSLTACDGGALAFLNGNPVGEARTTGRGQALNAETCGSKKGRLSETYALYDGDQRVLLEESPKVNWGRSLVGMVGNYNSSSGTISGSTLRSRGMCTDELFIDVRSVASCSASLIAHNIVMTAGHCIGADDPDADDPTSICRAYAWIFNLSNANENRNASRPSAGDVFSCDRPLFASNNDRTGDIAIIRLTESAKGRFPFRLNLTDGFSQVGDNLTCIGHGEGLPLILSPEGGHKGNNGAYILHDIDTFDGNSGSAVFKGDTVVGVHAKRWGLFGSEHRQYNSSRGCVERTRVTGTPEDYGVSDYYFYGKATDTTNLRNTLRNNVVAVTGKIFKVETSGASMIVEGFACALARGDALDVQIEGVDGTDLGTVSAGLSLSDQDESYCQSGSSHEFRIEVPQQEKITLTVSTPGDPNDMVLEALLADSTTGDTGSCN